MSYDFPRLPRSTLPSRLSWPAELASQPTQPAKGAASHPIRLLCAGCSTLTSQPTISHEALTTVALLSPLSTPHIVPRTVIFCSRKPAGAYKRAYPAFLERGDRLLQLRAMDTPPMHSTRPWTPPESDAHGSPESAYFSDPFRRPSSCASDMHHRWPLQQPRSGTPARKGKRCDAPNEPLSVSRPKPAHTVTEPAPYTPTKTSSLLEHHAPGALRYPYTPESSRILRASTVGSLSPIPWDTDSHYSASPVQSALSSCIAHFENLTSTRELTDEQMEYVVGQFENMTSFLSAPDAQTKRSTDDLFSGSDSPRISSPKPKAAFEELDSSYMAEVGKYIEGVQIYTADLKRRFDEAKALNEIQLAIIDDLRRDMNSIQQGMQDSLDLSSRQQRRARSPGRKNVDSSWASIATAVEDCEDENDDRNVSTPSKSRGIMVESGTQTDDYGKLVVVRKPVQPVQQGFWTALYEALDVFGDDLHER